MNSFAYIILLGYHSRGGGGGSKDSRGGGGGGGGECPPPKRNPGWEGVATPVWNSNGSVMNTRLSIQL